MSPPKYINRAEAEKSDDVLEKVDITKIKDPLEGLDPIKHKVREEQEKLAEEQKLKD